MRIEDIRKAIGRGRVMITDHADEEAVNDGLTFEEVYFSVGRGEVIESYPADRPYSSCLIYGQTFGGDPIHSVWAYNESSGWAVAVTVYRPNPRRWAVNFKTRRD